jgi:hypothetical protein
MLGGMHPLVAGYLRERSSLPVAELRQAGRALTGLLASLQSGGSASRVSDATGERSEDEGRLLESCMSHAEHLLEQLMGAEASTLLERLQTRVGWKLMEPRELALLGEALVASSLERGMFRLASRVGSLFLEQAERTLNAADPHMLRFKELLAKALRRMGEYGEAEELQRELLELRQRVGGETARETLLAKLELAVTRLRMGRPSQAGLEFVCETMREE